MKKWIVMLAVLVMFCLAGCGEKLPGTVSGNHKDGTERTRQSGKGRSLPERAAFHDASGDWRVIK